MPSSTLSTISTIAERTPATPSLWNTEYAKINANFAALGDSVGINVRSRGAVGNGSADDTQAFIDTVADAIAQGHRIVVVPPGLYGLNSTITSTSGVFFMGLAPGVPGGINASYATGYPAILKGFNGNLFAWNGADGLTAGSGGGMAHMRLVQNYGSPGAGAGSGILLTTVDASHKPSWLYFEDVTIEEVLGTHAPWTWAFNLDGGATNILDVRVLNMTTHTSGTGTNEGAFRLDGASQPKLIGCDAFTTGGKVMVGDTNMSSSVQCYDMQALTLAMDNCQDLVWEGGILSNITYTANTIGANKLAPGRFAGTFTGNQYVGLYRYSSTRVIGGATGGWRFSNPIEIPNSRAYAAANSGDTGTVQLISADVNNAVRINANADAIIALGAAPNFTGVAVGDTQVGGKLRVMGNLGLYGTSPVAQYAAIPAPTQPGAAYNQAVAVSNYSSTLSIMSALSRLGITL